MTALEREERRAEMRARFGDAVVDAHAHSIRHRREIEASTSCGCFYCLRTFQREQIKSWIRDEGTALCPYCGIDSVIGDASGYEISATALARMHEAWFKML
jgi:hypothetical protein